MTFSHSSRWIECPNTRKSIGNGFPMKKYVGAVVWKSFQLVIAAEIDQLQKYSFFHEISKYVQENIIYIVIYVKKIFSYNIQLVPVHLRASL